MEDERCIIGFGSNYFHVFGDNAVSLSCDGVPFFVVMPPNKDVTTEPGEPAKEITCDNLPFDNEPLESLAGNSSFTVFLSSGRLYMCGTMHGQVIPRLTRVEIPLPRPVTQVAVGRGHILALLEGGDVVLSWGSGHFGQLGHGEEIMHESEPTVIERLLQVGGVKSIAAGAWHSAAITLDHQVFMWGSNRNGQCGIPLRSSSTSYPMISMPQPIGQKFIKVSLGRHHSLAVSEDNRAYSWGSSNVGQTGHGLVSSRKSVHSPRLLETLDPVEDVAAGDWHSLALTKTNKIYSWGSGADGQLGLGQALPFVAKPKLIGDLDFEGIAAGQAFRRESIGSDCSHSPSNSPSSTRQLYHQRPDSIPEVPSFEEPPPLSEQAAGKISAIAAAGSYSAAISCFGDIYTWGYGDAQQLGVSPLENTPYVEAGPLSRKLGTRHCDVKSFDSRHNVLLPRRVEVLRSLNLRVDHVMTAGNHCICLCRRQRSDVELPLRTLYELRQERHLKGRSLMKHLSSSRFLHDIPNASTVSQEDDDTTYASSVQTYASSVQTYASSVQTYASSVHTYASSVQTNETMSTPSRDAKSTGPTRGEAGVSPPSGEASTKRTSRSILFFRKKTPTKPAPQQQESLHLPKLGRARKKSLRK